MNSPKYYNVFMRRNIYIAISVVAVIIIGLFIAIRVLPQKNTNTPEANNAETGNDGTASETVSPPASGKLITGSAMETFSGTITAVDTGCFSDKMCSVTVDGKKVILETGGRGVSPDVKVGKLLGVIKSTADLEKAVGKHANVYASPTSDGNYTIYGDDKYYVEVLAIN